MGISVYGQVCFGVLLDDGMELPWEDSDVEDWWTFTVCGFKHSFEIWDKVTWKRLSDITNEQVDYYYKELFDFQKLYPCPIELVNYCSDSYPMYILAATGSIHSVSFGDTQEVDVQGWFDTDSETEWGKMLLDFCQNHGIILKENSKPKWWLSCYYGV